VLPPFDDRKPGQFQTEVKKSVPPSKPEEVRDYKNIINK